jgi:tetratricopeptide (TPR) repeat protein
MPSFFKAAAAAFAFLAFIAPASAQQVEELAGLCADADNQIPADRQIASCTALIAMRGISAAIRASFTGMRAMTYRAEGDFARAMADYEAAIPQIERLLAAATDDRARADLSELLSIMRDGRGVMHVARGQDYRRALADFREAIRLNPRNPTPRNDLCFGLAALNESLDEARAACDAGLGLAPNDHATLDSRGFVGLRQARFQDAWNDYDAALRLHANDAHYLYGRGIAALGLGREREGRADLARATALDAEVAQTYAGYGIAP